MPTTTRPLSRYSASSSRSAGALAVQYGQSVDMNQRTSTTLPRSDSSVSGGDPIQSDASHGGAGVPISSAPSGDAGLAWLR